MSDAPKRKPRSAALPTGELAAAADNWPRLMRAETAARYLDERSVQAFRRAVGKLYPRPIKLSGKGERWLRDHLDQAINRLFGSAGTIHDIADLV